MRQAEGYLSRRIGSGCTAGDDLVVPRTTVRPSNGQQVMLVLHLAGAEEDNLLKTSLFRFPFPRRLLIRIHRDLFQIESYARKPWVDYPTALTLFEKMVLVGEDRRFFRHNG